MKIKEISDVNKILEEISNIDDRKEKAIFVLYTCNLHNDVI